MFLLILSSTTSSIAFTSIAFAASSEKKPGPIVVTIKPLYSLVAHLTEGVEEPVLLMKQIQSPHHYTMRPSERRLLSSARMIIWVGPQMESYLSKVIQQQNTISISAMQANGLKLLDMRTKHSHQHTSEDTDSHSLDSHSLDPHSQDSRSQDSHNLDTHIWLSSHNAVAISQYISQQLIIDDPENTAQYKENLRLLIEKISRLSAEIKTALKNNKSPFIAHHDAFQYFEEENKLNYFDSISSDEETGASLKHLRHIKASIEKNNIQCLVYQPPKPEIIDTLADKTAIKSFALDPLGQAASDEKQAWFKIMRDMAMNFKRCLSAA
jgi:zinc transport system substrate-binding protein